MLNLHRTRKRIEKIEQQVNPPKTDIQPTAVCLGCEVADLAKCRCYNQQMTRAGKNGDVLPLFTIHCQECILQPFCDVEHSTGNGPKNYDDETTCEKCSLFSDCKKLRNRLLKQKREAKKSDG
jgi:hypothetical protein